MKKKTIKSIKIILYLFVLILAISCNRNYFTKEQAAGKTVKSIKENYASTIIYFTDGTELEVSSITYPVYNYYKQTK